MIASSHLTHAQFNSLILVSGSHWLFVKMCVCVCGGGGGGHVYVVYEDTNLYNDMGMT